MNRSTNHLDGAQAHTFQISKTEDGRFRATTLNQNASHLEWFGTSETDAMNEARNALHRLALNGEI